MSNQFSDEIAPDMVGPHDPKSSNNEPLKHLDTVIALYDFSATQPSHLPLNLGDTVYVLSKSNTGWWDGVVISPNGELQRGWFPSNYGRSVNYVQPVLNKLKSNKELDSITAANTAANVLIPSFTNLLQKNLGDSEKNSPSNTSRKNSVVSFASSETSIPSDSKTLSIAEISTPENTPTSQSLQDGLNENDEINPKDVEEAERLAEGYREKYGKSVTWIPKVTSKGDFIFYCQQLDIYCESPPMLVFNPDDITPNFEYPSPENLSDTSIVHVQGSQSAANVLGARANSSTSFDALKRDSHSSMATQSSSSSYHHFNRPFFAMDNLFYDHSTDITHWSDLRKEANNVLDFIARSLRDQNRQLFGTHFSRLNVFISTILSCSRLNQEDFVGTKYRDSIRRKLKRIGTAFSQIYVNAVLHLRVLHNSEETSQGQLFSYDISTLNKLTNVSPPAASSVQGVSESENKDAAPTKTEQGYESYMHQLNFEIENLRSNINSLVKIFIKLSRGKKTKRSDYDSSDASDEEGDDRFDVLPQTKPRFLMDEFNGGNWCNPFFSTNNPALNVSGDDLKNRYHTKIIIDHQAYDSVFQYMEEMTKLSEETLEYLDPKVQEMYYYNATLKNERNTQILRLVYKYLYHASSMIDLIESFDFTVFCLIKRYSSNEGDCLDPMKESSSSLTTNTENNSAEEKASNSKLTFDYPVVLDFFYLKQEFHDLILRIIMSTQSLTLEDPEVFKGLRDEDALFYNRDTLKIPTEKASLLLSNILSEKINNLKGNAISINPDTLLSDYLYDGLKSCDVMLTIIQQLIEERETILNYATRVMHDDFDVQLLVMERNNTISSEKSDDHSYYSGGHKKTNDVPWYLEGDDEYDLLLDVKGNIKGGTKEALVAHLTHHDMFDSNFNAVFLLTFASMMSLGEFISLLIARFNIEAPEGLSYEEYNTWISKKQNPIRLRVMNIMKLLVGKHWSKSYFNVSILRKWFNFAQCAPVQSYSVGRMLTHDLQKLLQGEQIYVEREPVIPDTKPPAPLTRGPILGRKMKLLDIDYVELARQLTLREFRLYCKITKFACLAKVWGKKSGLNESIDDITAFIKASNQLTNFVAYMILRKQDAKKRVQIIRYFIQVAEKCRQYNNFSSMTAIISALYSSPIHRLKKTWKFVTSDSLSHLQNMNKLMNSSRNFNEYRDVLKFIGSEPCVPFFGVYLSDLTFVYHGNPDFLINRTRMINFAKRAKTCEIVTGIDRFKTIGYNFQEVSEIQKYLDSWFDKCPPIEEQYQISLNLEPREQAPNTTNTKRHN
ncbi:uncharacterized protein SPAPADRAFT_154407 [Spathaspora passalidarum NRRL Y-27907]|uniref:Cell division control protein 25 n=1 Tax=Spathaspora passalidarum (strain NRRL Y-27907 / 11-Y1) TaxID=619300 RepID=G3ARV0_SPAPN|nr:uncharacterized protein SPAPADRAFT_154407 [Spathaspora passalidarum NRRL Y-27907]EGW31367.1 hypothetical protein SPAPADRAFT_154407 [Spathaspora passalidarum NRRL Y-27907]